MPDSAKGSRRTDISGRHGAASLRSVSGSIISTVIINHVVVIINQVCYSITASLVSSAECADEPSHSAQVRATHHGERASDLSDHCPASH